MRPHRSILTWMSVGVLFALSSAAIPSTAAAQQIGAGSDIGIGLGKGTLASGLTGKYYLSNESAIQAHLGYTSSWGWAGCPNARCDPTYGFGLNVDYIIQFSDLAQGSAGRLYAEGGGGGAFSGGGPFARPFFALNGVLGLGWHFAEFPLEIVADWRPFISFGPGNFFPGFFDFGLSVRIYF